MCTDGGGGRHPHHHHSPEGYKSLTPRSSTKDACLLLALTSARRERGGGGDGGKERDDERASFPHGNGGSPSQRISLERNASLFFPAVLRPTQAQTPSVSPLYLGLQSRGLSRGSRAPSLASRHSPQPVPLQGHRRNQSAPEESPSDPWKPLPQRTHHRQKPPLHTNLQFKAPREPPDPALHAGNPRRRPRRWSPSRAPPASSSAAATPAPGRGPPHSLTSPLGRQTQRRAAPRRGGRPGPLPSSSCLRDAPRSAALTALRPRGHTPYQPEATASSRAWGLASPRGTGGSHGHAPGARRGGDTRGERGTGYGVREGAGGRGSTAGPERSQHGRRGRSESEPEGAGKLRPTDRPPRPRPQGPSARLLLFRSRSGS